MTATARPFDAIDTIEDLDAVMPEDDTRRPSPELALIPPGPSYTFYSISDLDKLPRQEWLIEGAIPSGALVGLIGPKGCYKTFVTLDLALHVAHGLEWHKRQTKLSVVAYVMAEGAFGALDRVNAWLKFYEHAGLSTPRNMIPIQFLPSRVPLNNPTEVRRLERDIRAQYPDGFMPELIIVDTLNRNLDGDEDGKGMTGYVAGCTALQQAFGCTVISVHHTPIGTEERGRGHSAFDGAIDTRLILSRDAERVTLECSHQRNGPDGWSAHYEAVSVAGSLVMKPSTPTGGDLRGARRELLALIVGQGTATYTQLKNEFDKSAKTLKDGLKWLAGRDYIKKDGRKYSASDVGRQALGVPGVPKGNHA